MARGSHLMYQSCNCSQRLWSSPFETACSARAELGKLYSAQICTDKVAIDLILVDVAKIIGELSEAKDLGEVGTMMMSMGNVMGLLAC